MTPLGEKSAPLDRYFAIMEAVSGSSVGLSRQDIEMTLDIPRTTALRLIGNLLDAGIIRESNRTSGTFVPGPRLSRMFDTDRSWLEREVRPVVRHLTKRTGLTSFVSRLIRNRIVSVMREVPRNLAVDFSSPGHNFPAPITATGRVICAHRPIASQNQIFAAAGQHGRHLKLAEQFETIRRQGYAVECGEHVEGRSSIAVPLAGTENWPLEFALGLTMPEPDLPQKTVEAFLPPLTEAAARIAAGMKH